jgi:integrase/recombinase XerD
MKERGVFQAPQNVSTHQHTEEKTMWYLDEFLTHLHSRQLSIRTIKIYRLHADRFIHFCEDRGIRSCNAVTDDDVHRFIVDVLDRQSHTPEWNYVALLCLGRYFAFLVEESILFAPPSIPVKKPRYSSGSYRALDKQTLRILLDQLPVVTDSDIMARAILELGYSAALRPGEIRALKIEDIDNAGGLLFIEQGKGKKDRTVPVGTVALEWVGRYIRNVRPNRLKSSNERSVFVGMRSGTPLTDRALTEFINYRLKRIGAVHISPHQLRASAATHMVSEGMSIGYLQRMLGHTRLDTTRIYVQIHAEELKQVMNRSHPRVHLEEAIQTRRKLT